MLRTTGCGYTMDKVCAGDVPPREDRPEGQYWSGPLWSAVRITALVFFFFSERRKNKKKYQSGDSRRTPKMRRAAILSTLRMARKVGFWRL